MLKLMITNLRPFTFNEKLSVGLLPLFILGYLVAAIALLPSSVMAAEDFAAFLLWQFAWLIITAIAACTAIATMFFKSEQHLSRLQIHLGLVLPLATLIVAMLLNFVVHDAFSPDNFGYSPNFEGQKLPALRPAPLSTATALRTEVSRSFAHPGKTLKV